MKWSLLAAVVAVGGTLVGAAGIINADQAPAAPPATFYGTVPQGSSIGEGVIAIVSRAGQSTVCGTGLVQPDTDHGNVLSYAVDVVSDGQIAGCGKSGSLVRFYFTPGNGHGGRMATDTAVWVAPGPVNKNLTALGPDLARQAFGSQLARSGVPASPPTQPPATSTQPTAAPTAAAPTATPTTVVTTGSLSVTSPVKRGLKATATIHGAAPGATCSIAYTTPAGTISSAAGLDPATAAADGTAIWTWTIGGSTNPGTGAVSVTCGDLHATASIVITTS